MRSVIHLIIQRVSACTVGHGLVDPLPRKRYKMREKPAKPEVDQVPQISHLSPVPFWNGLLPS
jgi:hypothetical protein